MYTWDNAFIEIETIISRLDEIAEELEDADSMVQEDLISERKLINNILDQCRGYGDMVQHEEYWFPDVLIWANVFEDYAKELITDCYDLSSVPSFVAIDWEKTAEQVRQDYSEVTVDSESYYYRG